MKKISLFSFALAGLMLGACSSETELVTSNQGPEWNANGKGYVNLAIQLPTQPSSRADAAFDDGTPAEYQVNNATLILFVNGFINSAYNMSLNFSPEGNNGQITTTSKITQEINEIANPTDIKALVVLNNNGLLNVGNGGSLTTFDGVDLIGKSLDELNATLKDKDKDANYGWHDGGFLMSNAVMASSSKPAEANEVDPLVTITGGIYSTKAEAEANPAATIYVERAEAKITVRKGENITNATTAGNLSYEIKGWGIDNYNKTNKLVRTASEFDTWKNYVSTHATDPEDYRFLGNTEIATGQNLYRFYWGDDYNYTATTPANDLFRNSDLAHDADGADAAYCFENTTDVATMHETNLTRVIVKAAFNNGQSFYIADDVNTVIWPANEENPTKKIETEILNRMLKDVTFLDWAKTNANTDLAASDFNVELGTTAGDVTNDIKVTLKTESQSKLNSTTTVDVANEKATAAAKNHIKLTYYAGGIAYYPVYIKHFDDPTQTPWNKSFAPGSEIYEDNKEQNYLGRYGVLRNNWYDITVNSIKGLGSAVIDEPKDEPVDKKESYISVDINILSWAKRIQNVDL